MKKKMLDFVKNSIIQNQIIVKLRKLQIVNTILIKNFKFYYQKKKKDVKGIIKDARYFSVGK